MNDHRLRIHGCTLSAVGHCALNRTCTVSPQAVNCQAVTRRPCKTDGMYMVTGDTCPLPRCAGNVRRQSGQAPDINSLCSDPFVRVDGCHCKRCRRLYALRDFQCNRPSLRIAYLGRKRGIGVLMAAFTFSASGLPSSPSTSDLSASRETYGICFASTPSARAAEENASPISRSAICF